MCVILISFHLFQLKAVTTSFTESLKIACDDFDTKSSHELLTTGVTINDTLYRITDSYELKRELEDIRKACEAASTAPAASNSTYLLNISASRQTELMINLTQVIVGHTELMKDNTYYNTYCIGINTIFASIFPFLALLFFNVSIALKLRSKKVR